MGVLLNLSGWPDLMAPYALQTNFRSGQQDGKKLWKEHILKLVGLKDKISWK